MNCMVKNGDEVSFGVPNDINDEDYRYIFRTSDVPDVSSLIHGSFAVC